LTLGDTVYAYLPLTNTVQEAFIIGFANDTKYKVHFKDFSYRYELFLGA
jgi:hypothetical protein